jgi:hypothetical protein
MHKSNTDQYGKTMSVSQSIPNAERVYPAAFERPLGPPAWLYHAVPRRCIVRTMGRARYAYVETLRIRFTSDEFLTNTRYHCRQVLVFIHPRDVRMAYALAADTGQHIGILRPIGMSPVLKFSLTDWVQKIANVQRSSSVRD